MVKKTVFLATILCFIGGYGIGLSPIPKVDAAAILKIQIPFYSVSKSKEQKEIEERIKDMLEELKKLEKTFKNKWQKEILPLIQEEIEKLREKLEEFHNEEDEKSPQWTILEPTPRGGPYSS